MCTHHNGEETEDYHIKCIYPKSQGQQVEMLEFKLDPGSRM